MAEKNKVLMIDDEPGVCVLVKRILEETGYYEVVTSSNPLEMENLCQKENPRLIILDNVMPQRNGSEIVKALKKDHRTKHIPIIMFSGKGEMVYHEKKDQFQWLPNNPMAARNRPVIAGGNDPAELARVYGVDEYIAKPFTPAIFLEIIQDVLDRTATKPSEESEI